MPDIAERYDYRLVDKHAAWTEGGPVVSRLPDLEIEMLEGRAAATVAEPSPMALFAFATGTWMVAVLFGGWSGPGAAEVLAPLLFLFAGVAQFIGGLYAYRRSNALAANAFCCYGALNAVAGVMLFLEMTVRLPVGPAAETMLGYLLCSFAFISLAFMVASLRRNWVMTALLGSLTAGYALLGINRFTMGPAGTLGGLAVAGAILLFLAAFFAYYLGTALVVNSTWGRRVLPVLGQP